MELIEGEDHTILIQLSPQKFQDVIYQAVNQAFGEQTKEKEKRIVGLKEFAEYSGFKTQTVYIKLHKGEKIPGSFKIPKSKFWRFNLDVWDQHLEEARENQFKQGL